MPRRNDLALGPILIILGALAFGLLLAIILLEAVLLQLLRWSSSRTRCLLDAALANVVSTALGLLAYLALSEILGDLFTPLGWLLMAAGTILVEAAVLYLRRPADHPPILRTAALTNIPGYLGLVLAVWLLT